MDYDAVIVGGGVAGLSIACALVAKGHATCVLESSPRVARSKRGLTLQANGLESMEKLGLLDDVLKIGKKTARVEWREIGGNTLATFDYGILQHPHNYLLTVVPSELEQLLRREFVARGGTVRQLMFQHATIEPRKGVTVKALRDGVPVELSAMVFVGADGEGSRVRQISQIASRVKEYSDHYLFMLAGPMDGLQDKARQYLARGRMVGFYPTLDSTYIFYYLPKNTLDLLKSRGLSSFKEELVKVEPDVSGALGSIRSWDDMTYASPRRVDVDSWVSERMALVGDAAHALDPGWAQGANMALQDAVALAGTLEDCFDRNDFSATALKRYESARRKQVKFIQDQAELTARITTTENRFCSWLGKRILRKTCSNPDLMRVVLTASSGLSDYFTMKNMIRFVI